MNKTAQQQGSGGRKNCGSCRFWIGDEVDGLRQCTWPAPPLPFWATIDDGHDHDDWTAATDGKRCETYKEKL